MPRMDRPAQTPVAVAQVDFWIAGHAEPLRLPVADHDVDRLNAILQSQPRVGGTFFVWEVPNSGEAAISIRDLQRVSLAWEGDASDDPGIQMPGESPEESQVRVEFRNQPPQWIDVEPDERLADAFFYLETDPEGFLFMTDALDQFVYRNTEQLVLLYAPAAVIREAEQCREAIRAEDAAAERQSQNGKDSARPKVRRGQK